MGYTTYGSVNVTCFQDSTLNLHIINSSLLKNTIGIKNNKKSSISLHNSRGLHNSRPEATHQSLWGLSTWLYNH
jgi:hypothetical protein